VMGYLSVAAAVRSCAATPPDKPLVQFNPVLRWCRLSHTSTNCVMFLFTLTVVKYLLIFGLCAAQQKTCTDATPPDKPLVQFNPVLR
jgi:hypothetical protein